MRGERNRKMNTLRLFLSFLFLMVLLVLSFFFDTDRMIDWCEYGKTKSRDGVSKGIGMEMKHQDQKSRDQRTGDFVQEGWVVSNV